MFTEQLQCHMEVHMSPNVHLQYVPSVYSLFLQLKPADVRQLCNHSKYTSANS